MLAGPNGSGKSFLVASLAKEINLGVVVNADELEAKLKAQLVTTKQLRLADWHLNLTQSDLIAFAARTEAQRLAPGRLRRMHVVDNVLYLVRLQIDSYLAAWLAELIRFYLIMGRQSMTFETVMSHPSKLEFLRQAKANNYRTYLYYVATDDWQINLDRVRARVVKGGHSVSRDKVIDRYFRSLTLLYDAVKLVDRAYIFDNSFEPQLIVRITDGAEVEYEVNVFPDWVYQHFHLKMLGEASAEAQV
jgi:predicted ABC-type ATPase